MCCFFWMALCLLEGTNSFVKIDESASWQYECNNNI